MSAWCCFVIMFTTMSHGALLKTPQQTEEKEIYDRHYWYAQAEQTLQKRLQYATDKKPIAKNIILVVGDGMSLTTTTAARILRGQRKGLPGEDTDLVWDTFPAVALAKTYNIDAQTGESSACATALLCGVKARYETLGIDAGGRFNNCASTIDTKVTSLIDWAHAAGKSSGIVTTSRVTHATPAALYAHSPSRFWEDDSRVPPTVRRDCKDIALQLLENEPGKSIKVIMGGGRRHFLSTITTDPEYPDKEGKRLDGRNLAEDWVRDKKKKRQRAQYIYSKDQLAKVDPRTTDYLLGLFEYSHMDFNVDRDKVEEDETKEKKEGDPSLADMTRKALSILMKNQKGFFLFIEGGRIDHGHHNNNPYRALDETLEMETALLAALERVNPAETLVVVTADHGHVMTFGGQSTPRGHPILGADSVISDVDDLTYTTILYGSGPGHSEPRTLPSNGTKFIAKHDLVHGAAVPKMWSTHGGEDVPVYALGPMATILFAGVVEQSYIAHAIAYAACLAHHSHRCISNNTIEKKFNIPLTAPTSFGPIGGPSSGRVFIAFSSWLRRVCCEDGPPMGPKLVGDVTGLLSVIQNCIQPEVTQEPVADETRNDESRKRNIVVASSVMSDERIHSSAQIFKPFVIFTYYIKFVSLCLVTNYLSKG